MTITGCLDESSEPSEGDVNESDNADSERNENGNNSDNSEYNDNDEGESPHYLIQTQAPEEGIDGNEEVCKFKDLPEQAQYEVEQTIRKADFGAEEYVHYETEGRPELLDTDCYTQYIEFETEYYWFEVISSGG